MSVALLFAVEDQLGPRGFDSLHPIEDIKKPLTLSTNFGVSTDHLVEKVLNLKTGKGVGTVRGQQEGGPARQAVLQALIPGDLVHFSNAPDFVKNLQPRKSAFWQAEWTVYMGMKDGKQWFVGQGFNALGIDDVYGQLAKHYQENTGKTLDPKKLEDYMAVDQVLQPYIGTGGTGKMKN